MKKYKSAPQLIPELKHVTYEEKLGMEQDPILLVKILNGYVNINFNILFQTTEELEDMTYAGERQSRLDIRMCHDLLIVCVSLTCVTVFQDKKTSISLEACFQCYLKCCMAGNLIKCC